MTNDDAGLRGPWSRSGLVDAEREVDTVSTMKEPKRTKLRDAGKLYVWTYLESSRSYAGWHLHADPIACARISEMLEGLERGSLRAPQVLAVSPVIARVLGGPKQRQCEGAIREGTSSAY
jgi:hypothetical protein